MMNPTVMNPTVMNVREKIEILRGNLSLYKDKIKMIMEELNVGYKSSSHTIMRLRQLYDLEQDLNDTQDQIAQLERYQTRLLEDSNE